ncbi:hypothetical protein BKH41_03680 [Helicobacter sp. 12S02232-10]|uniref:hypothetical protein n=1 Tax=Helicobacter sp. 12S02232-10 TaxID=1476197 RepID=UPI000BA7CC4A|nr:hypothetical protein [Helicobacter sp. 12S02232-10]PAF49193.1 hypothetical protein BKH41_03680 [Helicobacter sp. 12S02232-10]
MKQEEINQEIKRLEERTKDRTFGLVETFSDETYEALINFKISKIKAQMNVLEEAYKSLLDAMENADSFYKRPLTAKEKYQLVSGYFTKCEIIS